MANSDELKRAETGLRIAQLKFKQALKREDSSRQLSPVSLESSTSFCDHIDALLQRNTTVNVQTCKEWIVRHIAPSTPRIAVLGEYLVAVSKSVVVQQPARSAKAARSRLAVLLVISDVLHADKFHRETTSASGTIAVNLKPYIENLAELAALAVPGKASVAEQRLKAVFNSWAATACISVGDFESIRERVDEGVEVAQGATPQLKRTHALPDWFGDRNVPWHELSASHMVEPLLKNPDRAIPTNAINATRFSQKQPSERTRQLLDNYFENIDLQYVPTADNPTGETKKYKLWLDPMGQLVKQNKETQEVTTVCNGYGWSTRLCQDMQANGIPDRVTELRDEYKEKAAQDLRESRQRVAAHDHDPDTRSPRRRYSYSSNSRSRSRSRSRTRSCSGSSSYGRHDYDDRPRSSGRRRPSSRDDGRKSEGRANRFEDRGRQSQDNHNRKRPHDRQSRWNDNQSGFPDTIRNNSATADAYPAMSVPLQVFPPQPPHSGAGFVPPPPPPPGQFPGYPIQGFPPPPPPPPPQHFHGAVGPPPPPPPPPPNFQGPFYGVPPPNVGGFQNNAYQFGPNAPQYHGNRGGYTGQTQSDPRGGFSGGPRGRMRGGFQGQGRGQGRY